MSISISTPTAAPQNTSGRFSHTRIPIKLKEVYCALARLLRFSANSEANPPQHDLFSTNWNHGQSSQIGTCFPTIRRGRGTFKYETGVINGFDYPGSSIFDKPDIENLHTMEEHGNRTFRKEEKDGSITHVRNGNGWLELDEERAKLRSHEIVG
ncbi:hypothetical protein PMIN07_004579 [Paraphaeosphaeria minitans]